jgi:hypothetical protein
MTSSVTLAIPSSGSTAPVLPKTITKMETASAVVSAVFGTWLFGACTWMAHDSLSKQPAFLAWSMTGALTGLCLQQRGVRHIVRTLNQIPDPTIREALKTAAHLGGTITLFFSVLIGMDATSRMDYLSYKRSQAPINAQAHACALAGLTAAFAILR